MLDPLLLPGPPEWSSGFGTHVVALGTLHSPQSEPDGKGDDSDSQTIDDGDPEPQHPYPSRDTIISRAFTSHSLPCLALESFNQDQGLRLIWYLLNGRWVHGVPLTGIDSSALRGHSREDKTDRMVLFVHPQPQTLPNRTHGLCGVVVVSIVVSVVANLDQAQVKVESHFLLVLACQVGASDGCSAVDRHMDHIERSELVFIVVGAYHVGITGEAEGEEDRGYPVNVHLESSQFCRETEAPLISLYSAQQSG